MAKNWQMATIKTMDRPSTEKRRRDNIRMLRGVVRGAGRTVPVAAVVFVPMWAGVGKWAAITVPAYLLIRGIGKLFGEVLRELAAADGRFD